MGTMNVGKVSFGNAQPAAGTAQGAQQQQAPVKKADKGDVVVIGGKEFTKKQAIAGGVGILGAVAAVATAALSAHRGKNINPDAKFIDKLKEGFHTLANKEARAEYAEKFGKKAKQAADAAGEKVKDAVAEEAGTKGAAAAEEAADKGAAAVEEKAAEGVKPEAAPAPAKAEKTAEEAVKKGAKSEDLEQKVQTIQAKLDEQNQKLADLKAEQTLLEKRANDLPGVIQKHKDEVDLAKLELDEAQKSGASKKEIKEIKQKIATEQKKLDGAVNAQKEVDARKKAVDGQIKGFESKKAVEGRKNMEKSIAEIKKQVVEAKKAEYKENSEELKKLNQGLENLKNKRAKIADTDANAARYDRAIEGKQKKIDTYTQEADKLVEAKINLDAKDAEIQALKADINKASKADKPALETKLKALKAERQKLNSAYTDADIALFKLAGGVKKA